MDRRALLGSVSRSFVVGTAGGFVAGGVVGAALAYDPTLRTGGQVSYAQQGEDLIIASLADHLGIKIRNYLDIGACDPIRGSNTYLFYLRGATGLLIEPNPDLTAKLHAVRPRDGVYARGIGPSEGTLHFYMIGDDRHEGSELNTFSRDAAEKAVASQGGRLRITKVVPVVVNGINEILGAHFTGQSHFGTGLDLLSTDTEGFDLPILSALDFSRYRPRVLCAETMEDGDGPAIVELLKAKGYMLRGKTFVNSIFTA